MTLKNIPTQMEIMKVTLTLKKSDTHLEDEFLKIFLFLKLWANPIKIYNSLWFKKIVNANHVLKTNLMAGIKFQPKF